MKTFLSYPSEKLEWAREVHSFLLSLGIEAWFDKENLIAGQEWGREIAKEQKGSELIILICSSETVNKSGVIQREIKEAVELARDKPYGHVFLLPLRTEDVILPDELGRYQYIDLFRPGWQLKLARSLKFRLEQLKALPPNALIEFFGRQQIHDKVELKSLHFKNDVFEAQADYFIYRGGGLFWDYVSSEITTDVVGGFYRAKADGPIQLEGHDRTGDWSIRVEEYFNKDELVSLRFFEWADYGGAHPSRGVYSKNFGGERNGKLRLDEIFDRNPDVLKYLRKQCENEVRVQTSEGDDESDYTLPSDDEVSSYMDPWDLFAQWNFDQRGLLICLSESSGLPYVMGVFDVLIPWDYFRDKVSLDFRETPVGRFITGKTD